MAEGVSYKISLEDYFSKGIKEAEGNASSFEKRIDSIGEHAKGLGKELLAAFGVVAGFEFFKGAAESFMEDEKAAQQLKFTVGARGGLASDFEALREESQRLQEIGIFDNTKTDEAAKSLLNYGISVDQVKESLKPIEDAAAVTGQELESLTEAVAKSASTGQTRGIKDLGLGFLKLENDMSVAGAQARNMEKIMAALKEQFGGGLENIVANTEFGKMEQLKNQFDELKKDIGRGLMEAFNVMLPSIKSFIESLRSMVGWIKENWSWISEFGKAALITVGVIKTIKIAESIWKGVQIATQYATQAVELYNAAVAANPIGAAVLLAVTAIGYAWIENKRLYEEYNNSINERVKSAGETEAKVIDELTKKWVQKGATQEEATKIALNAEKTNTEATIKILESQLKQYQAGSESYLGISQALTEEKAKRLWLTKNAKDLMSKSLRSNKLKDEMGNILGSDTNEPKASKIQSITFNLNQPFQNQKISLDGSDIKAEDIAPKFTEFLISLVQDAAIIATE